MTPLRSTVFFIFIFNTLSAFAIDLTNTNIAWQYNPQKTLKVKHRVVLDDTLSVFLEVKSLPIYKWDVEYYSQENYSSYTEKKLAPVVDTLANSFEKKILQLSFTDVDNVLVLVFKSQSETLHYDIFINESMPDFYPIFGNGLPVLENYFTSQTISLKGTDSLFVTRYQNIFEEARPPFADMPPLAPSIPEDSSFIATGLGDLKEGYLYTVAQDSLTNKKIVFLKLPPYYPKYRKLPELVESVFYLANEVEKKNFIASQELKKSFDSFWISLYETRTRAKNAIKNYYDWIEYANYIFTDFKEGWKTDRGMIHVVYGPPDEVYRTNSKEIWKYDAGYQFEFLVLSTFFADRTYTLKRKQSEIDLWNQTLSAIRRGINE